VGIHSCAARGPKGYYCTLMEEHTGDHEAYGGDKKRAPYEVWPNLYSRYPVEDTRAYLEVISTKENAL